MSVGGRRVASAARLGFWRPALLLGGLLAAGSLLHRMPVAEALHPSGSPAGAALFLLLAAVLCAAGLPRQAVAYAAGYAFGLFGGVGLAMAAQVLGCMLDMYWARSVARGWAQRRLRGRLAKLDRLLADQPFTATLTLRLLPVGNNLLLNLLAAVSTVPALPFLAGSAVGYLPQTLVFVLAGSGTRLGRGSEIGIGAAMSLVSAALGGVMLTRLRRTAPAAAAALSAAALSADAADARYAATPIR